MTAGMKNLSHDVTMKGDVRSIQFDCASEGHRTQVSNSSHEKAGRLTHQNLGSFTAFARKVGAG